CRSLLMSRDPQGGGGTNVNVSANSTRSRPTSKIVLARLALGMVALIVALGFAPSAAQAAPASSAKAATVTASHLTANAVQPAGTVKPNASFSYRVYCYAWGCEAYFTVYSGVVRFDTYCNGWGWVYGAWVGRGSWHTVINCGSYRPPRAWRFDYFG